METKTRPHTLSIRTLREKVKALASGQRPLKRARKTKISEAERLELLKKANAPSDTSPGKARWLVMDRRAMITACLNLSHELRESKYRHGIRPILEYDYKKAMESLRKELNIS